MQVFGDIERVEEVAAIRASIADDLDKADAMLPGFARHERLVSAFVRTGELVQGLLDEAFEKDGIDEWSPLQDAGARLLRIEADAIVGSWRSGFESGRPRDRRWSVLLERLAGSGTVRLRQPEGYAFYAVYPESYAEAACRSGLPASTVVIGIRSIGTGLAAMVSAALGAAPAFSLRPHGHPFERRVAIGPALTRRLLGSRDHPYAIVDEGPGLSGSSFGSVADWLEQNGVDRARIHFFPSHDGNPGPKASETHVRRWKERPHHVVTADALLSCPQTAAFPSMVSDVAGARCTGWRDISGGSWREIDASQQMPRPPVDAQFERRKVLFESEADGRRQRFLVKFAGLGEIGTAKARRGGRLCETGLAPRIVGTCHGFIVQQWVETAPTPITALPRRRVLDHLARYLGFRARHLPAGGQGAGLADLCDMAVYNLGEAFGEESAEQMRRLAQRNGRPSWTLRRIDSDNRLHAWEWLVTPGGDIVKADALDHNCAHDLVGRQDIAWDVAGAAVEFDLTALERRDLADAVGQVADGNLDDGMLALFEACYLGFQAGFWSTALVRANEGERPPIAALLSRYRRRAGTLFDDRDC